MLKCKKMRLLFVLFCIIFYSSVNGQCKTFRITSKGDTLNSNKIKYNQERIFSLGLFSKVSIYPSNNGSICNAIIEVEEVWYIYPIPFIIPYSSNIGIFFHFSNHFLAFSYSAFLCRSDDCP